MKKLNYKISVSGLGYVGLPVLIAFSKIDKVIGFDINRKESMIYLMEKDKNNEVKAEDLINPNILFSNNIEDIKRRTFI